MPELLDLLTDQYKTVDAARGVARRAALREKLIAFSEPVLTCWLNVLDQARLQNKVNRLVDVACQEGFDVGSDRVPASVFGDAYDWTRAAQSGDSGRGVGVGERARNVGDLVDFEVVP